METRKEQLRNAKRRQRLRDAQAGQALYQVKLPTRLQERLRLGMADAGFLERFAAFLRHEFVRVEDYPNLALLCWNREVEYMGREDAFRLYERNWRLVDESELSPTEENFIDSLKKEFGHGLINA